MGASSSISSSRAGAKNVKDPDIIRCVCGSTEGRSLFYRYLLENNCECVEFFTHLEEFLTNPSLLEHSYNGQPYKIPSNLFQASQPDEALAYKTSTLFRYRMDASLSSMAYLLVLREYPRLSQNRSLINNLLNSQEIKSLKSATDKMKRSVDAKHQLLQDVVEYVSYSDIYNISTEAECLQSFFRAMDILPLCVSITMAIPGNPLIFVNKAFELFTGYNRHDVKFVCSRFLCCPVTEQESLDRLIAACREGVPEKVVITNKTRDGTLYRNMLAVKPIFDTNNRHRFMVSIQLPTMPVKDVIYDGPELTIIQDILELIPSVLPTAVADTVELPDRLRSL
mmetsp:Transcript_8849/g.13245  ORF Transcript_8849/g.13245 Transcript_8849/m.13245 type:complete len:338 (-) Transcript_8849:414-1427(-)|eukprot:CAMPEP_0185025016 /NCGR_PEP_ID=MMETSP1103-20130426/8137_1 /TAXON_ID=36769 /ORGANISM="Paraphysomonas bandaiensis, Strain Caron Lab Isolate" /LENGTH=337 /DNA_ID=CAMNT_0027558125 /DNA_START=210 /DNA_END=1223 /DNA_ORIENTATION=-